MLIGDKSKYTDKQKAKPNLSNKAAKRKAFLKMKPNAAPGQPSTRNRAAAGNAVRERKNFAQATE